MAKSLLFANIDIVVGVFSDFQQNQLPTADQVLKRFLFFANEDKFFKQFHKYTKETAVAVQDIWFRTKIPIINTKSIVTKVDRLVKRYQSLKKKKHIKSFELKTKEFWSELESQLFDIAICQCGNNHCKCAYSFKVPMSERDFLADQRSKRQLFLPSIDNNVQAIQNEQTPTASPMPKRKKLADVTPSERENRHNNRTQQTQQTQSIVTNRIQLENTVRESQRYDVSSRATSTILNAFMKDIAVENENNAIDRNKINRQTEKYNLLRENAYKIKITESLNEKPCFGLFFDGKKDKTKTALENVATGHKHLRTQTEEHYTILLQPDNIFYSHVSPSGGTGKVIAQIIFEKLKNDNIDLEKCLFIGCDETAVNTGHKNGAITLFEKLIGYTVHWSICALHFNELPLREYFTLLDGETVGPTQFSGEIGKMLTNCEQQPVGKFVKIFSDDLPVLNNSVVKDLSQDQRYLYEICHCIQNGSVNNSLAMKSPGTMVHSRFLTTANRILRLYVAVNRPPAALKALAKFVVKE